MLSLSSAASQLQRTQQRTWRAVQSTVTRAWEPRILHKTRPLSTEPYSTADLQETWSKPKNTFLFIVLHHRDIKFVYFSTHSDWSGCQGLGSTFITLLYIHRRATHLACMKTYTLSITWRGLSVIPPDILFMSLSYELSPQSSTVSNKSRCCNSGI